MHEAKIMLEYTRQRWLGNLALCISAIFCADLTLRGLLAYYLALDVGRSNLNDVEFFQSLYVRAGVEYSVLIVIYGIWLFYAKKQEQSQQTQFVNLCKSVSIVLLLAFLAFPETSDIFQYLHYGLMGLSGVSPYLNPASSFASSLSPLLVWGQSSTYALVSQLLYMFSAAFVPLSILLGVYVFKFLCLLIHLFGGYLLWRHLQFSHYRDWLTLAYLVNPMLLFELVVNAHVDILICTALIAIIILLRSQRHIAASVVLWMGFLSKTIPIIWLPLLLLFLWRNRNWKSISMILFISCVVIAGAGLIAFPTAKAWTSILNPGTNYQTAGSLHNIIDLLLSNYQAILPEPGQRSMRILLFGFRMFTYLSFVVFYLKTSLTILLKQRYSETHLIQDMGWITVFLFLFATPWYQPWYACILVPFIVLMPTFQFFSLVSSVYCLCSTIAYYLLAYTSEQNLLLGVSLITVVPPIVLLLNRKRIRSRLVEPVNTEPVRSLV